MGGTISVGIRHNLRGKPVSEFMHRWTNDIQWRVWQPDFLDGKGNQLKSFLNDQHSYDDNYCVSTKRLQASEYGYILIDLITKEVFSANHYSNMERFYYYPKISTADDETFRGLRALCESGKISYIEEKSINNNNEIEVIHPNKFLALDENELSNTGKIWSLYLSMNALHIDIQLTDCH